MFGKLIKTACLALALTAATRAGAFTMWGPLETWQTADLDYSSPAGTVRYYYWYIGDGFSLVELGGPKNFGQGSRLTTPIITYAFDNTFLEYFGAKGVSAVNSAMQILNSLPSSSSASLNQFMTSGAQQINYTAQALGILDIKSTVLWMMIEHMGLLGETHIFDLRIRAANDSSTPCSFLYAVVNRNYDPVTYNPTAYVNGRLYTNSIWDGCTIGIEVGATMIGPTDTAGPHYSAVATGQNLAVGAYYLNITRDDMGGLRYLYNKNNFAFQPLDSNSVATLGVSSPFTIAGSPTNGAISNLVGLLGGVEKITFVKVNYDSQLGGYFKPVSFKYTIPYVTNSKLAQLHVTRTVTAPDIIFTAADLVVSQFPPIDPAFTRTGNFLANPYTSLGGGVTPSTIDPSELVVLNNVGAAIFYDEGSDFLNGGNNSGYPNFVWGSFDGSTNSPIVYPIGSSLAALEAQVFQGSQYPPTSPWSPVVNTNTTTTTTGTGASTSSVH